ncbi:MAG: hypothetical protein GY858_00910 [Candidatus Omnitrophica bacterium]|nr:hypothetical protein [Candidatus Omnitrophota bacterium]
MKKIGLFCLVSVCCFFITGCATQRGWRYQAEPAQEREPLINKSVAVPPFKDNRPDKNTNAVMMYLVPLMPYGWCDYSIPESGNTKLNSTDWQFKPTEDLAKAAAEELRASGLFKEVFFTQRASEGDLVFQGTINSTRYWGKMYSYCLSVYGPNLWFLGLPAGTVNNELGVSFKLSDNSAQDVIWERNASEVYNKTFNLYSMPSDFTYDILYKKILLDSLGDLEGKL